MTATPMLPMNDGRSIPQLGLGVWQMRGDETAAMVRTAIEAGYRLIDTAPLYGNEAGVGDGIRSAAPVPFITTKLWNDDQGFDKALRAFDASLARLKLEAVDLFLIHWPAPGRNRYIESWKALLQLRDDGKARSVGVSNFTAEHLMHLADATGVMPALNQIELHPAFQQTELRSFHDKHGIVTQAWSPLGQAQQLDSPVLKRLAEKHGKSPAQIVIRWHLDQGHAAIPKSSNPARIRENIDVFGFALDRDDHAQIATFDRAQGRIGPDPDAFS